MSEIAEIGFFPPQLPLHVLVVALVVQLGLQPDDDLALLLQLVLQPGDLRYRRLLQFGYCAL